MRATKLDISKRLDLRRHEVRWRGNVTNESLGGGGKPRAQASGWGERNDGAQQRALVGAKNKVLGPCCDQLRIPVAEARC